MTTRPTSRAKDNRRSTGRLRGSAGHCACDCDEWYDDELYLGYGYAEGIVEAEHSHPSSTPVLWIRDPQSVEGWSLWACEPEQEPEVPRGFIGFEYGR